MKRKLMAIEKVEEEVEKYINLQKLYQESCLTLELTQKLALISLDLKFVKSFSTLAELLRKACDESEIQRELMKKIQKIIVTISKKVEEDILEAEYTLESLKLCTAQDDSLSQEEVGIIGGNFEEDVDVVE